MSSVFEDTSVAFALKSDSELEKAYFLFKLISKEPLVKIGVAVTNFALKVNLPVEKLIKVCVFDHFCGGISEEDCMLVVNKLFTKGVTSVLDYSVEGKKSEQQFERALNKVLKIMDFVEEKKSIPFAVFKPTGFGDIDLFEKVGKGEILSKEEQRDWERIENRFDTVCKKAYDLKIALLVDAEESWMQDASDNLVEKMMQKYNKKNVIVYNTLQLYRWDRIDYLRNLHQRAKKHKFKIGMKLVRGAYMEKERKRAKEEGYTSPICTTKEATDANYNNGVRYMLNHIKDMALYVGTHNEESSELVMKEMERLHISIKDPRIYFGQLYGMSDHITYNLAKKKYNVSKYLPYGPIKDVMPYLIRRAEENTSVVGQTGRELSLLKKELKRRKLRKE